MTTELQRRLLVTAAAAPDRVALASAQLSITDRPTRRNDRQLSGLLPLVDSVVAPGRTIEEPPVLLMAPPIPTEVPQEDSGHTAFASIADASGGGATCTARCGSPEQQPVTQSPSSRSPRDTTASSTGWRWRWHAGERLIMCSPTARSASSGCAPSSSGAAAQPDPDRGGRLRQTRLVQAMRPFIQSSRTGEPLAARSHLGARRAGLASAALVRSLNRLRSTLVNARAESQRRFVADAARTSCARRWRGCELSRAWSQAAGASGGSRSRAEQLDKVAWRRGATSQLQ